MTLETVRSSAIHAIGYDAGERMMEVIFTGGGIYQFSNVPPHVFAGFRAAASKGNYFQDHIRGHFRHQRLGRFRQRNPMLRGVAATTSSSSSGRV
ncbi:MAG: KTSC domain-containing protein [Bacteroidota bacterium]